MFPQRMEESQHCTCSYKNDEQLIKNHRQVSLLPVFVEYLKK